MEWIDFIIADLNQVFFMYIEKIFSRVCASMSKILKEEKLYMM